MLAVALDTPQLHDLAALGARAPLVLSATTPRSPILRYRVPAGAGIGRDRWVKVVLRVRIVVPPGQRGGRLAHVVAETDRRVSASIELEAGTDGAVTWNAVWLHGGSQGVAHRGVATITLANYVRTQATRPGAHTLRFRIKSYGLKVTRAEVASRSGLLVTRQPPQALTVTAAASPSRPAAGSDLTIRVRVGNRGRVRSGRVHLEVLPGPGLEAVGAPPQLAGVPAGGERTAEIPVRARAAGQAEVQVMAAADVGQALADAKVTVTPPPPVAPSARPNAGAGGGTDLRDVLRAALAALAAAALAVTGARRHRRA